MIKVPAMRKVFGATDPVIKPPGPIFLSHDLVLMETIPRSPDQDWLSLRHGPFVS
jgi:hypothetical protein